jgi:hypothetical protein
MMWKECWIKKEYGGTRKMKLNIILIGMILSSLTFAYQLTSIIDELPEQEAKEEAERIISPYEFQKLRKECHKKPECYKQKVFELKHKKLDYI